MQPVLTLLRCRSSTPLREKAKPKRLLAIQCWGEVGVRLVRVPPLPPRTSSQGLATYFPQQVPDANDAAQAQAHQVLGVKLVIDDLWAERPGKSTPRGRGCPSHLSAPGRRRAWLWALSQAQGSHPQSLHFPRGRWRLRENRPGLVRGQWEAAGAQFPLVGG